MPSLSPSSTPRFFVLCPAPPPPAQQASTSSATAASTSASASASTSAVAPATFQIREHKKRKFHVKSRSGCLHCKRKRVKCDEKHPFCKRCERNNTPCVYDNDLNGNQRRRALQNEGLADPLAQPGYQSEISTQYPSPPGATPIDMLLNHFTQNYMYITECSWMMPPWTSWLQRPYLCTVTLAIAACHLRCHVARPKPHILAECHLKDLSVNSFTKAIGQGLSNADMAVNDTDGGAEALVGTALTIHMLAFALVDDVNPSSCWAFSSDPDRLKWLEFQLGVKPFINGLNTSKLDVSMSQMVDFVNDSRGLTMNKTGELSFTPIPDQWQGLVRRRECDRFDPEVLESPLRALAEMRNTEPDFMYIFIYMQFIGKLSKDFIALLLTNDHRALWIFAYWLGMLGRYGYWWMSSRIHRDFYGIITFLKARLEWHPGDRAAQEQQQDDGEWENLMSELSSLDSEWGGVVRKQG